MTGMKHNKAKFWREKLPLTEMYNSLIDSSKNKWYGEIIFKFLQRKSKNKVGSLQFILSHMLHITKLFVELQNISIVTFFQHFSSKTRRKLKFASENFVAKSSTIFHNADIKLNVKQLVYVNITWLNFTVHYKDSSILCISSWHKCMNHWRILTDSSSEIAYFFGL